MRGEIDNFYIKKDEPVCSCLIALRRIILESSDGMTEAWQYKMPFFLYRDKRFCYLWVNKKTHQPYLGIVEGRSLVHPKLILESRSRMKIMLIDPTLDLPKTTILKVLKLARGLY